MTYDGSNDDKEVKMVSAHNKNSNNNYNVVINFGSDHEVEKTFFWWTIKDEIKVTHKITFNPNIVLAMKNSQASYNEDADEIDEQAAQEKD